MLPPAQQEAVNPLVQSLGALIERLKKVFVAVEALPPRGTCSPAMDDRTKESLAKLQQMLSGFTESICSDEAAALPLEEKQRLTQNITVQVSKIMQALQTLPPQVAAPIVAQCREVIRLSEELLNRPSAGHGQARGQRLGQPMGAAAPDACFTGISGDSTASSV